MVRIDAIFQTSRGVADKNAMMRIILACLVFNTGLIISTVVHSETPIEVDEQTGKYLDGLGASHHGQTSANYHLGQHGSQYLKDSMNHRNNSAKYNALIVNPFVGQGRVYLQDSMNKRNNPSGKYYEPDKFDNPAINVTSPHRTIVRIPIKEW